MEEVGRETYRIASFGSRVIDHFSAGPNLWGYMLTDVFLSLVSVITLQFCFLFCFVYFFHVFKCLPSVNACRYCFCFWYLHYQVSVIPLLLIWSPLENTKQSRYVGTCILNEQLSAEKIVELESGSWGSEQFTLLVLDRIKVIAFESVFVPLFDPELWNFGILSLLIFSIH